jgi:hypothetical protein
MTAPDLETKSRRLNAGTCELLGLDPEHLTLTQKIRVSRASALRLQIDDLEKAQLLGQPIDIHALVSASEALEKLVTPMPNGDDESKKYEAARIKFEKLIDAHLAANEQQEPRESLHEENSRLLEENFRLKAQLNELTSAKSKQTPQPTPTKQDNNVVPLPMPMSRLSEANSTKPPAHYLKQTEPWEDYYNGRR